MILKQITKKDLYCFLLLGLFLFISYLPLSSFLFALKNDALTDNFPPKYFFSAALHSGYLPLWNPYINFGIPIYADPGFAFWQPITWLFGLIGYNVYVLTIEVLFYIWMGGIGMYLLGRYFRHSYRTSFLMAAMYICCGFFVGHLQHINFITCAAFLPLVLRTFLALQEQFSWQRLLFAVISLYFLTTGGHPAIPFGTFYFLLLVLLGWIFSHGKSERSLFFYLRIIRTNLLLLIFFLLVISPLLFSYFELLPHFNRATPVLQSRSLHVGFSAASYISFLYPFGSSVDLPVFSNDSIMRNGYFSLIGLFTTIMALFSSRNRIQNIFLIAGGVFLILSLGGIFKLSLYSHLLLLKYIRTNGEFRVFSLFSFIVLGSFQLERLLKGDLDKVFIKFIYTVGGISLILIVISLALGGIPSFIRNGASFADKIKDWMSVLNIWNRLFINALFVCLLTGFYLICRNKFKPAWLITGVLVVDLTGSTWMLLPVTGVQKRSAASIQGYFENLAKGIPVPKLDPLKFNVYPGGDVSKIIGCWSYYTKQPGTPEYCDYPTIFNSTENYFSSTLPPIINEKPFVYLRREEAQTKILIDKFTPDRILLDVNTAGPDSLVLLQNKYPRWHATINGVSAEIQTTQISFMTVGLKNGENRVEFYFQNQLLIFWLALSIFSIFFLTVISRFHKSL